MLRYRTIYIFVLLLILMGGALAFSAEASARSGSVVLLSTAPTALEFNLSPQIWRSDTVRLSGADHYRITYDGAEWLGSVGMAALPGQMVTVAVPWQGPVDLEIVEAPFEEKNTRHLLPIPYIAAGEGEKFFRDAAWYGQDKYLPEQIVTMDEPTYFRRQRVVKILLQPLQYNPQQGRLRLYKNIRVRLRFAHRESDRPQTVAADEDLYRATLLNYDQGRSWRGPAVAGLAKTASRTVGNNWYKLIIRGDGKGGKEGVYKVDGTTLKNAGVPISTLDPSTLQLFNNGGRELPQSVATARPDSLLENPIQLVGVEDGRMDAEDYLLFYGRSLEGYQYDATLKRFSHYINHYGYDNVYWLTFGNKKGLRISDKAAISSSGVPVEASFRDLAFVEDEKTNVLKSGLEWFGYGLSNDKRTFSQSFSLPGAIPKDTTIYRVQMAVSSTGNHQFRLLANGNTLGEMSMVRDVLGYTVRMAQFVAPGTLLEGNNTVSVNYLTSSEIMLSYVDWIEIEYNRKFSAQGDWLLFNAPRRDGVIGYRVDSFSRDNITVWDVTDFTSIQRIASPAIAGGTVTFADRASSAKPRRYLAFTPTAYQSISEIRSKSRADLRAARQVDYIIITYDDFYQQAMQLKSLRENWNPEERLATEVVKISEVMDEFAWGLNDPVAIRDFLVSAYNRWNQPRYVLLLGDGHYDYRNLLKHNGLNPIPPYETADRSENDTRATDDWFTYLRGERAGMQMAIGRMPVQSMEEATAFVNKTIAYETNYEPGEWRKTITILGDDELVAGGVGEETAHTNQAETLAESHVPDLFNVRKIYLTEYPIVRTVSISGVTKPQANEALIDQINQGTLILNFIGHGNDELWTHEQVLNAPTDFNRIQNPGRLALWVAATCEFAYWDQPDKQSFAERIANATDRGSVAMVASSRVAFSYNNAAFNYAFFDTMFKPYLLGGPVMRLGDAVLVTKNNTYNDANCEKYAVLADPALRIGAPRYRARIQQISPDTLQALRKVRVTGVVQRGNADWNDFNGKLLLRVMDARKKRVYETKAGNKVSYILPGNSLFRGVTEVRNGRFELEFIVPKDISYGGSDGRLSMYFWNDQYEGVGNQEDLMVGGTAVNLIDHDGPEIKIGFGENTFSAGDFTTPDPWLKVVIRDSLSGVNIAGDIGHQISMVLDDQTSASKDMTQFFEYDAGSYTSGLMKYQLTGLSEGNHHLQIKAWDNSNNSNEAEMMFQVVADSVLTLRNLLNYPNPMVDHTRFSFELSNDALVSLRIYSVAGRLLKKFDTISAAIGFNLFPELWDGSDEDGDVLANGVYLYKLEAVREQAGKRSKVEKIGKVVIAR